MSKKTPVKIGVGADPEFFLLDKMRKRITSAHTLVPGTKKNPYKLKKGAVQVDGTAVEFNIDPAYTSKQFVQNNTKVLEQIREMIPHNYEFVFKPSVLFDEIYFEALPDNPKELGCDPDYNAAYGTINPQVQPPLQYNSLRTGAGHLHVSWTKGKDPLCPSHRWDCETVVKALEFALKPFTTLWDDDRRRSQIYGSAFSMRYKSYGVEWRSPSNAWLNYPKLWPWLFEAVKSITQSVHDGTIGDSFRTYLRNGCYVPYGTPEYHLTRDNPIIYGDIKSAEAQVKHISTVVPGFPALPDFK